MFCTTDLRVPWWISPIMSERLFLTKSLEWSLSFCILEYMFNEEFVISSSFLKNVPLLQTRLRVVGLVHMLLLPFMVIFMSIHFFLQNAQSFHSSKSYLGPRQWSPLALWSFREFNELPHIFNERINKSYEPANEYIQSFSNPYSAIIASFVVSVAGAFIAIVLLISFFSEGVLLYVSIFDHNLLWYLGIFSGIFAGARSLIPDKTKKTEAPSELLANISSCTHYYPAHWMNRCHTTLVKDEMSELFPFKVHLFGMELLSVILTPIVLCLSLPPSAQSIIDFVR
jgi:autophagy-related protein 9